MKKDYIDFYETTRYKLVRNLCVFFMVLLSIVSLVNMTNENYNAKPNLFAVGMCILSILYLRKTKDYKTVSKFASITSFVIISLTYFLLTNALHYTTPMWMMMNILFTYFTLNKIWGTVILTLHFCVLVIYLFTKFDGNVQSIKPFVFQDMLTFSLEFSILAVGMGYLLFQFINTNNYAERELTTNNRQLSKQNKLITKQNEEKDIMLKEIHHRVKNNLQIISSLLRLQSERSDTKDSTQFTEAINRVNAMALIHEKMYQGESLTNFDMKNYLTSLARDVASSYSVNRQIDISINSTLTKLYPKNVVPIALLFNELMTNSIKHAFKSQTDPEIKVEIYPKDDHKFILEYSDNGHWREGKNGSFGLELIDAMTDQLDGQKKLQTTEKGSFYVFELTNKK